VVSIVLILEPGLNFFLVGLAYVGSGPAGYLWRWRTGRTLLPVEGDGSTAESEGDAMGGMGNATVDQAPAALANEPSPPEGGNPNVTSLSDHGSTSEDRGGREGGGKR